MLNESTLRALAEAENAHRRLSRERDDQVRHANQALLKSLLPVFDNLQRCAAHVGDDDADIALREAIQSTAAEFRDVLQAAGLEEVTVNAGDPFDPSVHDAVHRVHAAHLASNAVVEVVQPGFRYRERLLRPARVAVNVVPPAERGTFRSDARSVRVRRWR